MTYDEAIAYIRSHPAQFKGESEDVIMSKIQSSNDPNYYQPTLYEPTQKKTVVKPNTATRGATVSYKPAAPTAAAKPAALPAGTPSAVQSLHGKLSGTNALPWILGIFVVSLGAGMAIYRAAR